LWKKNELKFPKGFFRQSRPTIDMKESLKDNLPFKWSSSVLKGRSKVKIASAKKGEDA